MSDSSTGDAPLERGPVYRFSSAVADVTGPGQVFGTYVEVYDTSGVLQDVLVSSPATWMEVKVRDAQRVRLVPRGPALARFSGEAVSGLVAVSVQQPVRIGFSRASLVYPLNLCNLTNPTEAQQFVLTAPVTGSPCGGPISRGVKEADEPLADGYTALAAGVNAPAYVLINIALPVGDGLSYPCNSYWFGFNASDLPPNVPGTGIRLGDLSPLSGTAQFAAVIDHNVTDVGIWTAGLEVPCSGLVNMFAAINVAIWPLKGKRASVVGGYTCIPAGFAPASLPATFFLEQEVRNGPA
jgi:hypothetical protein